MADKVTDQTTTTGIDVTWIVLRTVAGFAAIRLITKAIRFFSGIYSDLISVTWFTCWIFLCVRGWAKAEGYTLEKCRITRFLLSWKDVCFVVGFLGIRNWLIALTLEDISVSGLSLADAITMYLGKILNNGIGSGLNEELVFRGYLLKSLEDKVGIIKSMIIVSAVFGIAHLLNGGMTPRMMLWIVIGTASLGVMFAAVTYYTGSIWRAVITHACCNLNSIVVGFEEGKSLIYMKLPETVTSETVFCMSYALTTVMCLTVSGFYFIKTMRGRKHEAS